MVYAADGKLLLGKTFFLHVVEVVTAVRYIRNAGKPFGRRGARRVCRDRRERRENNYSTLP